VTAFLLDTNVLSELRKGRRADSAVRRWAVSTAAATHKISVLSLGEIRKGIETIGRRAPDQAEVLASWLDRLHDDYGDDLLAISPGIADRWGRLNAVRTLPVIDGLLAATAMEHDLILATRNTSDFQDTGVSLTNPFKHPAD